MTSQTTTSRLGPLQAALVSSRDYSVRIQSVELRDDRGTTEQLYAIVNSVTGVVEARLPTLPEALTMIVRLQSLLNEARQNGSSLEFHENTAN